MSTQLKPPEDYNLQGNANKLWQEKTQQQVYFKTHSLKNVITHSCTKITQIRATITSQANDYSLRMANYRDLFVLTAFTADFTITLTLRVNTLKQ